MNNQQEEEYMNSLHPSRSVLEIIYYVMTVVCVIGIVAIIFQLL